MTYGCQDIVVTINWWCIAMYLLFAACDTDTIVIKCISTNQIDIWLGQCGDFILVMTDAETCLPTPILVLNKHSIYIKVYTWVLQRTIIWPHCSQTCDVTYWLASKQVVSIATEVFNTNVQTVLQQTSLQTDVVTFGSFPLQFGILDIWEYKWSCLVEELWVSKVSTSSVVIDIVVTANFVTTR